EAGLRGVFNVAGPPPLPLSHVIAATGRRRVPVPSPLVGVVLGRLGLPTLPIGAVAHLKYPVVVDASAFRAATGFVHEHPAGAALAPFREACPPPVRAAATR